MTKNKKIICDTIINILIKTITFIMSLVLSKKLISGYNSSINGLFSLIGQIFTYVALLEAGIGNATQQQYFNYLAKDDYNNSKAVFDASKRNYIRASYIYFVISLLVSILIPFMANSGLNYFIVFFLSILQGLSGILTFTFLSSYKNLMISSGDYKISNIYNSIAYIGIIILKILVIAFNFNIVFIQLSQIIGTVIEIIITRNYCRKKYKWLEIKTDKNIELTQRKAFLVHEISGAVFSSTDIIILSIFCSLKVASVYSVYNIVYSAIASVASVISTSIIYYIGIEYNKNTKEYYKMHDKFECIYISLIFSIVISVTMMCMNFIRIYTKGITDINYVDRYLPVLFATIQILTCGRSISNRVIGIAGFAKETQFRSVIETVINIVASIILTTRFGIYGVLLGTIIATTYRTIDVLVYVNTKILKRINLKIFIMLFVDFIISGIMISLGNIVISGYNNYFQLIIPSIICGVMSLIIFFSTNWMIYLKLFKNMIIKKN